MTNSDSLNPSNLDDWKKVMISNSRGLHARAAAKFVKVAGSFKSTIFVSHRGTTVSGRSIMGLMMLAAAKGCEISLQAKGVDSEEALSAIIALIEAKFDED
jgi:phosphocarrier protein